MPSEDLTLVMRARGADRTAREIDQVGRSVQGVGAKSVTASKGVDKLSKVTSILSTKWVILGVVLATVIPLLGVVIALLGVGLVTAIAFLLPVIALGIGAMTRFTETVNRAGYAANELRDRFKSLQEVAAHSIAKGADKVLWSLVRATTTIQPLIHDLQGSFTSFGAAAGHSIESFAKGLVEMGPTIKAFMAASEALFHPLSRFFLTMLESILRIGTVGVPVLAWMLNALSDSLDWLATAAENTAAWMKTAEGARTLATIWGVLIAVGGGLLDILVEMAKAFFSTFMFMAPFLVLLGNALSFLSPVIGPLAVAFLGLWGALKLYAGIMYLVSMLGALKTAFLFIRGAILGVAAAQWILNGAMLPMGFVVLLVVAALASLAYLLYLAWTKSETFRNIVVGALKAVWAMMKNSPIGWLVRGFIWLVSSIWNARRSIVSALSGIWEGFKDGFVATINFIIRQLNRVIRGMNRVSPFGDIGAIGQVGGDSTGAARGGLVGRGGTFEVGERGREKVSLPAGSMVTPYDALDGGGDTVVNTELVIDGATIARLVERHAKRKKSVR